MSKNIRFIGDTHGKWLEYLYLIDSGTQIGITESCQVGDMGIGFGISHSAKVLDSLLGQMTGKHRFIRGNHDDPAETKLSSYSIPDAYIEGNMMFVGGAFSIDKAYRTPGKDWWPDEELSVNELLEIINIYDVNKPEIMVTHEFPERFAREVLIPLVHGISNLPSRTRNAFDEMFEFHKPKIWIGGHWHVSIDMTYEGTRFIVLPELGYIDIDVENI